MLVGVRVGGLHVRDRLGLERFVLEGRRVGGQLVGRAGLLLRDLRGHRRVLGLLVLRVSLADVGRGAGGAVLRPGVGRLAPVVAPGAVYGLGRGRRRHVGVRGVVLDPPVRVQGADVRCDLGAVYWSVMAVIIVGSAAAGADGGARPFVELGPGPALGPQLRAA